MGVDFIRTKVRDHRKKYAAMARYFSEDWIGATASPPKRVYKAVTEHDERLDVGECVVLRKDGTGALVASKDLRVVARLPMPSRHLERLLDQRSGVATATVYAVSHDSHIAELKVD